jgi:hypothetical protein
MRALISKAGHYGRRVKGLVCCHHVAVARAPNLGSNSPIEKYAIPLLNKTNTIAHANPIIQNPDGFPLTRIEIDDSELVRRIGSVLLGR